MSGKKHGKAPGIAGHAHGFAGVSVASAAVFSPMSLSSLALWLRADQGITFNSGVQQWNDISGNGRNFSQGTPGSRPQNANASDAAYNNQATVETTTTGRFMQASAFTLAQPYSILIVGQFSTAAGAYFYGGSGTPPVIQDSSGNTIFNAGTSITVTIAHTSPCAMLGVFNGASSLGGVSNWLTGGTSGNAGSGGFGTGAPSLFSTFAGTATTVGKMAEVIVWGAAASSTDKSNLASYILARYGITVT